MLNHFEPKISIFLFNSVRPYGTGYYFSNLKNPSNYAEKQVKLLIDCNLIKEIIEKNSVKK